MRKKYLSALLFGALLVTSAGTFTSCKDYDDEINDLQEQVNTIKTDLESLKTTVEGLDGVKTLSYADGKLIIETGKGQKVEVDVPSATGVTEVKLEGNVLYVDGKEAGKVEIEEGQAIKVEVKEDGKLYINDEVQDLEIGSKVVMVDNGNGSYTMTVDGTSYVLPKYSAATGLTSLKFEDENTDFDSPISLEGIAWNVSATDKLDWAGKKGAVKRNQLLVGQITSVNVQVTPASFNLGEEGLLSLKDSKGNIAPVKVSAVKNNMLLTRSGNSGSWLVSIQMDETITKDNIYKAFDVDGTNTRKLYALCVDGEPVSNYDIAIDVRNEAVNPSKPSGAEVSAAGQNQLDNAFIGLTFVSEEGLLETIGGNDTYSAITSVETPTTDNNLVIAETKLPVGEIDLTPIFSGSKFDFLYDSYITFEGTNKSLAASKQITADGMTIKTTAASAGTTIVATVHFLDITGKETAAKIKFAVESSAIDNVSATPVEYKVMPSTIQSDEQISLAAIEVKDLEDVFAKIDAATLEKAKVDGQISIEEEKDQTGFIIHNDNEIGYTLYDVDGKEWDVTSDDLLDLSTIKFEFKNGNKVAKDAKPGTYNLYFVVKDKDTKNELIRVKMEVKVSVPAFTELFAKLDTNWKDGQYVARITPTDKNSSENNWGTENATINLSTAFKAVTGTKADPSQLGYAFKAINDKYPISNLDDSFNFDKLNAISGTAGSAILNKEVMYNKDLNALAVTEIADMVAYTSVLAGLQSSQVEGNATTDDVETIQEAFSVTSEAYTTKVVAALDGVKPVYFVNKVAQSDDYVITLAEDGTITPLTFVGNDYTKGCQDGFGLVLNGDYVSAKWVQGESHQFGSKDLNGYQIEVNPSGSELYHVTLSAVSSEGEITWNLADGFKVTGLDSQETSTVSFTLTDATGIVYPLKIVVKKN